MKLSKTKTELDLDRDLPVSEKDLQFLGRSRCRKDITMDEYIDFLEETGSLRTGTKERKFYDAIFEL